jgi:hypothetical protein
LVWRVLAAVGELDLSAIYAEYRETGVAGRRMSRR